MRLMTTRKESGEGTSMSKYILNESDPQLPQYEVDAQSYKITPAFVAFEATGGGGEVVFTIAVSKMATIRRVDN
jgi:hypothetical protein